MNTNDNDEFVPLELNQEQQKAVECDENNAYFVKAGAGTGKTRVLTFRIAYLLSKKNYNPERILALTFTNRAAREMIGRLKRQLPNVTFRYISTFHSFCLKFLKEEIKILGWPNDFTLIDQDDVRSIIDMIYSELERSGERFVRKNVPYEDVLNAIQLEKHNLINSSNDNTNEAANGEIKDSRVINTICKKYHEYLKYNAFLDLDDLLFFTKKILFKYPEIREKWQNKFDSILIDEFQDVNSIQYDIFYALVSKQQHFFVVGDPDNQFIHDGILDQRLMNDF